MTSCTCWSTLAISPPVECGRGLSPPRWFEDAGRGGPAYKERGYSFDEKTGQVAVQIVAEPLALGEHELAALAADDLGNSGLRSWKFTVKKQALPILEVDPNQDEPLKLEPWNPPLLEPPPKPEQKTTTDAREPKKPIEPTEPEVEPEPETPPALVVLRSLRSTVCLGRAIAGEPPEPPSFAGLAVGRARPQEVEAKLGPPLVVGRDATGTRVAGHDGHRFGLEAIVVRYRGEEAIEQIQLRFARPVPREDLVAVLGLGPPGERRAIEGGTVEVFAPAGIELTAGMAGVTRLSLRAP
jgi:hypothetical protein